MRSERPSDDDLLQAIELDLVNGFPQLVEAYQSQLYWLVVKQVKDEEAAKDIVQDSWVRVYQALNRYPGERIRTLNLRPWLFTIVRHRMNTYLTSSEKKNASNTESIDVLNENLGDNWTQHPLENTWIAQPEEAFEVQSRLEEVRTMIEHMSERNRTVLTLRFFEGLEPKEIANRLNISEESVSTYVSRGRKILREKLVDHITATKED